MATCSQHISTLEVVSLGCILICEKALLVSEVMRYVFSVANILSIFFMWSQTLLLKSRLRQRWRNSPPVDDSAAL